MEGTATTAGAQDDSEERAHPAFMARALSWALGAGAGLAVVEAVLSRGDPARAASSVVIAAPPARPPPCSSRGCRGRLGGWSASSSSWPPDSSASRLRSPCPGTMTSRCSTCGCRCPPSTCSDAPPGSSTRGLIALGYGVALRLAAEVAADGAYRWLVTVGTVGAAGLVVDHLVSCQRTKIERLTEAARSDPLTGLLNRKGFDENLAAQLATAERRRDAGFGLIVGDLDGFKQVNDSLGHAAGDETLRAVARVLDDSTRGGDRPARLGGEEFALIAPDADRRRTLRAAERVRRGVEEAFARAPVPVTISFGVAVYPQDGTTAADLMAAVDRALYRAKAAGRNRTVSGGPE